MKQLTKAVLLGVKYREPVELIHPASGDAFTVFVRPLSDGEAEHVQALKTAGLAFDGSPEEMQRGQMRVRGDLSKLQAQQAQANRQAVAYALCMEETWTAAEIARAWPPEWVAQVAQVVYRITGIKEEPAAVKQFRQVAGGDADPGPGGSGGSPGADGGGPDTASANGPA